MNENSSTEKVTEEKVSELAKKARIQLLHSVGYEAGEIICRFFDEHTNHPHPWYTFNCMAGVRERRFDNTSLFANSVAYKMARLVIENDKKIKEGGWEGGIEVSY